MPRAPFSAPRWLPLAISVALVGLCAVVYFPTRHFEFVNFDDAQYVSQNPNVQQGLTADGVKWALTTGHGGNWFPLTWMSHMLDVQLFGLDAGAHHVMNVALHSFSSVLLFVVFFQMTSALWRSAIVAALFAVHPTHVESVAWVAERKDVLSGLWWMATLLCYVLYSRRPNIWRYLTVLILFALGLMSKPMVVTLPIVLLLLDFWPLGRAYGVRRTTYVEKIPFVLLALASSIVTFIVQQRAGAVKALEALPLTQRLGNALVTYVAYIVKTVWPAHLAALYPYEARPIWMVTLASIVLVALTILAIRGRRTRPYFFVGWFWYLVMLVPVIGLIQVGSQPMADRYLYLPSIGLFLAIVWSVSFRSATIIAAIVVIVLAVVARAEVNTWHDSVTLWRHAIAVTGPNYRAHNNLAQAYAKNGRTDAAIAEYREAIRIFPDTVEGHDGLGLALAGRGQLDEAIQQFSETARLNPRYAPAHLNLATALASQGQFERAVAEFSTVLELDPESAPARLNMAIAQHAWGNSLADENRPADSIAHYDAALRLDPKNADVYDDRGRALLLLGRVDEAVGAFNAAAQLMPTNADAHYNLGVALVRQGRTREAIVEFHRVLQIDPSRADAKRAITTLGGK